MRRLIAALSILAVLLFLGYRVGSRNQTVASVQAELHDKIDPVFKSYCQKTGFVNLPQRVTLVAIKEEKRLELWFESAEKVSFVRSYLILAASGTLGPKLKEGDRQVPEGVYRIEGLNPNSGYHLSMKVNYPNSFDQKQAAVEGRQNLGGDIFIHGKAASIGCLAMGDAAIEELFFMVSKVGYAKTKVIIAPVDFRKVSEPVAITLPWQKELYEKITAELKPYN